MNKILLHSNSMGGNDARKIELLKDEVTYDRCKCLKSKQYISFC